MACLSCAPSPVPLLAGSQTVRAQGADAADTVLLDRLQADTFRYFVDQSPARTGLTRDRSKADSPASTAAVGFALTAYPVGVQRGYVSRSQAVAYSLKTLRFLWNAPQGPGAAGVAGYKGLFYHFLDTETGARAWKCELSTIDTALLMAGVVFAQQYYDGTDAAETEIRQLADKLYRRVDWVWAMNGSPKVSLGWQPESGFMPYHWGGYNEGMILYLLGLGSPTFPLPDGTWQQWAATYRTAGTATAPYIGFGPLFGHQYSHTWVDFRGLQDPALARLGIDYFENSRRATLAHQAYAIANPQGWRGYNALNWGLTACDGPGPRTGTLDGKPRTFLGYSERGIDQSHDDGTIAPTAALGSLPFAPEIVLPTLRHWHQDQPELWGRYGLVDAYNPSVPGPTASGWVDTDYLAIDEGPILLMAENYRSHFVWDRMHQSPDLRRGLARAGLTAGSMVVPALKFAPK